MDIESVKLRTLANLPTDVNGVFVYPVSLRKIVEIGYEKYNNYLSILSVKKEQLVNKEYIDRLPDDIEVFNIINEAYSSDFICSLFNESLKLFMNTDNIVYKDGLYINGISITGEIYHNIVKVISIQNGLKITESDNFNPKNERVKKIKEKMLENQRKIQELKKNSENDSENLTFSDLVSIVSSNVNGINILNVFDLNIFQFNDQFNRMKLLNDYEVSIQSILHGADPKNVEIKHWISKS